MKIEWDEIKHNRNDMEWDAIPAGTVFGIVIKEGGSITPYIMTAARDAISLVDGLGWLKDGTEPERIVALRCTLHATKQLY